MAFAIVRIDDDDIRGSRVDEQIYHVAQVSAIRSSFRVPFSTFNGRCSQPYRFPGNCDWKYKECREVQQLHSPSYTSWGNSLKFPPADMGLRSAYMTFHCAR
jgi:hypothetical protein